MTATHTLPRGMIERAYQRAAGGQPGVPAADRAEAVRWLRRALIDFDALDQHIAALQELAGSPFTYPRPRRDRWPEMPPEAPDPGRFANAAPLPPDRLQAVL